MRYLKEYKDIDWDDWDIEEDELNNDKFIVFRNVNYYYLGIFVYINNNRVLKIYSSPITYDVIHISNLNKYKITLLSDIVKELGININNINMIWDKDEFLKKDQIYIITEKRFNEKYLKNWS